MLVRLKAILIGPSFGPPKKHIVHHQSGHGFGIHVPQEMTVL